MWDPGTSDTQASAPPPCTLVPHPSTPLMLLAKGPSADPYLGLAVQLSTIDTQRKLKPRGQKVRGVYLCLSISAYNQYPYCEHTLIESQNFVAKGIFAITYPFPHFPNECAENTGRA